MQQQAYDQLVIIQDTYWYHDGIRKLAGFYLDRIRSVYGARGLKILDIGCGTGAEFAMLRRYGRVTGLDISEYAAEACRKKFPDIEVRAGSADKLAEIFPGNSFDVVICFNMLYHRWVNSDAGVISQMHKVLSPAGFVIIIEPAFKCLYRSNDKICYGQRRYSASGMKNLLGRAGFSISNATYFNAVSFLPVFLLSFLQRFGLMVTDRAGDELKPLPKIINDCFKAVMALERWCIRIFKSIPIGVSLLVVAKKEGPA